MESHSVPEDSSAGLDSQQDPRALQTPSDVQDKADNDKTVSTTHKESLDSQDRNSEGNLVYTDSEVEPEIHVKTWIALAAMFLLNFVQVFALSGPPAALTYIGQDLNGVASQTWVPDALSLVQAVLSPVIASASGSYFQLS